MKVNKNEAKEAPQEAPAPVGMFEKSVLVCRVKDKQGRSKEEVIGQYDSSRQQEPILNLSIDLSRPSSIKLPLPGGSTLYLYSREADPVEDEAQDPVGDIAEKKE